MQPAEVVRHAKQNGLSAIALTDHDNMDGVQEAMEEGKNIGLEVVPGVELSVQSATETHILGYDIDIHNDVLIKTLEEAKQVRKNRNAETSRKLREIGFDVSVEEAEAIAPNGVVGRAHFAKVMVQKGMVGSVKEAFDRYLANGRPAYSSTQLLTPEEGVQLIQTAGGKAFVAHLHLIRLEDDALIAFLKRLQKVGLSGVEGYYTEYTPEMQEKYQNIAQNLGLKISGGTDFHGEMKPHIAIGRGLGNLEIPYSVLEQIRA